MNFTKFSVRRPVTISMIFLSFIVIGAIASKRLSLELMPNTELPFIYMYVPYFRSSPEQVEKLVTKPIEEIIALTDGVKNIDSLSGESGAEIFIEFKWGVNSTLKAIEIREKLENIKSTLPSDVGKIFFGKWSMSDIPILELTISSKADLKNMHQSFDKHIKQRIKRIDGVSKVDLFGVSEKITRVNLRADRIKAHKIDLGNLINRLDGANFSISAGTVKEGNKQYFLRPIGELSKPEDLNQIILNNQGLRIIDIATVTNEIQKIEQKRHLNGKNAIGVDIYKESGANIVEVSKSVMAELKEIQQLPAMKGIEVMPVFISAESIESSLNELLKSGFVGLILAIVVLFVFLRQTIPTLIVAASIPLSLFFTLACMYFLGYSLNILTMLGLLLAVGMIVDNSVVIVENIHRHLKSDSDGFQAIILASDQVSLAIAAGTLTTIIVFLPNMVGESVEITYYLKHIGMTFSIALCSSLLTAQTVIPMLTLFLKPGKSERKQIWIDHLANRYQKVLAWTLNHPSWMVFISIALLVSVWFPLKHVKSDLMSTDENRILQLQYNLSSTYPLDKVENAVSRMENYLLGNKSEFEIKSVYSNYSRGQAITNIHLLKGKKAVKSQTQIQKMIKKGLPELVIGSPGFSERKNDGKNKRLSLILNGSSYEELVNASVSVKIIIKSIKGIGDVTSERNADENNLLIIFDREKVRNYGLSSESVANQIALAMRGYRIKNITTSTEELEVEVIYDKEDRQGFENLKNLSFDNGSGDSLSLDAFAKFKEQKGPSTIYRKNRRISLTLYIEKGDLTIKEIKGAVEKTLNPSRLPAGISWNFGDSVNQEDETERILVFNVLLAIVLIFLVMASLFESILFPWAIWISISYAVVGVYWFFMATGTIITFMAWIGVLVLTGVVVNNGIVLIDTINQYRIQGQSLRDALIRAGGERMRPILMTAATTILGLLPLCFSTSMVGGDGPPYYPMARAIVGGLVMSTFVTLVILPTLYNFIDNFSVWLGKTGSIVWFELTSSLGSRSFNRKVS